ncbi:MAG: hypothetical protein IPM63_06580 [Acidobacteriota bacterium]|nr:MAG: hypothetical protein IPM63_06580 [Acidobacteriota bacterium]
MSLRNFRFAAVLFVIAACLPVAAHASETIEELAHRAVSGDTPTAHAAIESLRKMGYEGLDALLSQNRDLIEARLAGKADPEEWNRAAYAIDSVARQKDAWASGLFWHTDLDSAKAEAARTGRPIVSLRLLGNLDEELSCANSRFFRSILYTDNRVKEAMRENFVLHWRSERPAPVMTVDFGDGRKLVTTVTGNSIHYFLSPEGRIIDALPGLYSPEFFAEYLGNFPRLVRQRNEAFRPATLDNQDPLRAPDTRFEAHRNRVRNYLLAKWRSDLLELGVDGSKLPFVFRLDTEPRSSDKNPSAVEAAPRAITKMVAESDLLQPTPIQQQQLLENTSNIHWKQLAERFGYKGISDESLRFVRAKYDLLHTKSGETFRKMTEKLVESVSLDTVRNAYFFHTQILKWLNEGADNDLEAFNARVYSEVFLTPASDPWLGLYRDDVFLAVERNGIIALER